MTDTFPTSRIRRLRIVFWSAAALATLAATADPARDVSVFHPRLTGLTGTGAELTDTSGRAARLEEMQDRIVMLSLTPETCDAPCAAQQALLGRVRQAIDATPMRDMVTFVHVQASGVTAPSPNLIVAIPDEGDVSTSAADLAGLSAAEGGRATCACDPPEWPTRGQLPRRRVREMSAWFLYINGLSNACPVEPGFTDRLRAFR